MESINNSAEHLRPTDSSNFIGHKPYFELLDKFRAIGLQQTEPDYLLLAPNRPNPAFGRSIQNTEVALTLAAGDQINPVSVAEYFDKPDQLLSVGRGLRAVLKTTLVQSSSPESSIEDLYRYVCGYRLEFVVQLSRNMSRATYYDVPPFLGSYTLAFMARQRVPKGILWPKPQQPNNRLSDFHRSEPDENLT